MDYLQEYLQDHNQARRDQVKKLTQLFLDDKPTESEEGQIKVISTRDSRGKIEFKNEEFSSSGEDEQENEQEATDESKQGDAHFDVNMNPMMISRVPLPSFGSVEKVFRCPLCYNSLSDPVSTRCCVTRFCSSCMLKYLGKVTHDSQHPCPCCRAQIVAMRACRPDSNLAQLASILRNNDRSKSVGDDFNAEECIAAHKKRTEGFLQQARQKSKLTIDKSITRANKVVRNVRSGKEGSRVTGARSPTKGHVPFDPIASGREPMRVRRHNRRERESDSDDDEEKQGDDEEEEEPEVAIAPRRELADYDGSIERTIHFSLQPILGVQTNNDKFEVRYYEGHVEVSSNLFTSAGATDNDDSYALEKLPNFDDIKVTKKEHLTMWRQIISRSVATRGLERSFITASTNMTIGQLISFVVGEKKKHDEVLAGMCGLKNVPVGVWNDYTRAAGRELEGSRGENNSGSVIVNGRKVRTDYRFNYDIWLLCNDVPVKMEPTFRMWEVARAFWRADYPLTLYYRNIGTTPRGTQQQAHEVMDVESG